MQNPIYVVHETGYEATPIPIGIFSNESQMIKCLFRYYFNPCIDDPPEILKYKYDDNGVYNVDQSYTCKINNNLNVMEKLNKFLEVPYKLPEGILSRILEEAENSEYTTFLILCDYIERYNECKRNRLTLNYRADHNCPQYPWPTLPFQDEIEI